MPQFSSSPSPAVVTEAAVVDVRFLREEATAVASADVEDEEVVDEEEEEVHIPEIFVVAVLIAACAPRVPLEIEERSE